MPAMGNRSLSATGRSFMEILPYSLHKLPRYTGYNKILDIDPLMMKTSGNVFISTNAAEGNWNADAFHHDEALLYSISCTLYLGLISVIGVGLNLAYVVLFSRYRQVRGKAMGVLYMNLCVADLTISTTCVIKAVNIGMDWRMHEGEIMCNFFGITTFIGGMVSIFTLMVVAIYRHAVTTGKMDRNTTNWRAMAVAILSLWAVTLILATGPLVGWNSYYPDGDSGHWCSLKWSDRSLKGISYLVITFSVVFLIPVTVMTFCYASIWCKIKQISTTFRQSQSKKAERVLIKSSCMMSLSFVMAWGPYATLAFLVFIGVETAELPPHLYVVAALTCKITPCINPIIYFRTDPAIQKLKKMLKQHILSLRMSPTQGERATIVKPSSSIEAMNNQKNPEKIQLEDEQPLQESPTIVRQSNNGKHQVVLVSNSSLGTPIKCKVNKEAPSTSSLSPPGPRRNFAIIEGEDNSQNKKSLVEKYIILGEDIAVDVGKTCHGILVQETCL